MSSVVFAMAGSGQQAPWFWFIPYALILGIFYFLIIMPMKKRQRKIQDFQSSLKVGDKVVTTSGIYGKITRVNDNSVQLEVADKVRLEIARQAIGGFQGQAPVVSDSGNL